ncbi:glycosyltransferase family 2 protein [Helicobacter himalayensis]|uniref:glycosyltransferase family 2 protein n=1 Tax=Helicobacter himalayensis TaxID=1591088 RepID=UPI0008355F0C|nr:glycosyltransferase [Helicobacter himalayensis]
MPPKISVIIPVFNEERTILQVIDEILTILPQAHIAVFDNNSTDNSKNLVLEKIKSLSIESAPEQPKNAEYAREAETSGIHFREGDSIKGIEAEPKWDSLPQGDTINGIDSQTYFQASTIDFAMRGGGKQLKGRI